MVQLCWDAMFSILKNHKKKKTLKHLVLHTRQNAFIFYIHFVQLFPKLPAIPVSMCTTNSGVKMFGVECQVRYVARRSGKCFALFVCVCVPSLYHDTAVIFLMKN